jgi:hypothetical protein
MKRMLLCALMMGAMLGTAEAQIDLSKLITGSKVSPEAIAAATIMPSRKLVWIFYHAPSVRDPKTGEKRHVFNGSGALQPDDSVWRLGADYATVLHTDADLDIAGLAVPKGDYTLYIALDKGNWQLIVNKQLMAAQGNRNQWGINRDNSTTEVPAQDLGRVPLTMGKPSAPVETLKISVSDAGGDKGKIDIAWENVTASVPFTVKAAPAAAK